MSLLPNRCQIQDDMPMSLGKAIAKAISPSTEPSRLKAFEAPRLGWVETKPVRWDTITEEDCRQIKGAASAQSQPESGQSRSETVVAPPYTMAAAELAANLISTRGGQGAGMVGYKAPSMQKRKTITPVTISFDKGYAVATPAAPPSVHKFKPGDRVRWTEKVLRDNMFESNEPWCIARIDGNKAYEADGTYARFDEIELVTPPASETEADRWVEWKGGEPPAIASKIAVRFDDGDGNTGHVDHYYLACWTWDLNDAEPLWDGLRIVAYKVIA